LPNEAKNRCIIKTLTFQRIEPAGLSGLKAGGAYLPLDPDYYPPEHRRIWPANWMCEALGVSRGGFYAWLTRPPSARSRSDEGLGAKVRASFLGSDRTYGASASNAEGPRVVYDSNRGR
jgi:hypothetical protein